MEAVETKRIGKYEIEIVPDSDPESPREWDSLGTMVCFHRRYNLGDKHDYRHSDYDGWEEMEKAIIKNENAGVILPLYLYDHSGITISTTGFSCDWDSGQIGFIFISKEKMLKEYGGKIVTKKLKERVEKYLVGQVETYDQYLTGDVYGYRIYEVCTCDHGHEHREEIDSCWGYYGEDSCMEEADSIVNSLIKHDQDVEQTRYP
jgi:hypothetical protein